MATLSFALDSRKNAKGMNPCDIIGALCAKLSKLECNDYSKRHFHFANDLSADLHFEPSLNCQCNRSSHGSLAI